MPGRAGKVSAWPARSFIPAAALRYVHYMFLPRYASGMSFRARFPSPWFYEEHHNRIAVRDAYGEALLTIHFQFIEHPGKRGAKFPQMNWAYARSLALGADG